MSRTYSHPNEYKQLINRSKRRNQSLSDISEILLEFWEEYESKG